ncbi:AAA family ATPase [bacterium]|nr:AAA family ATPase [candidate division CSSED10-310 bacterium]
MIVHRLELSNIRSYRELNVMFNAGMVYIIGGNGAGKSTMLRAIGFALFDHTGTGLAQLLRKRERSGWVKVCFSVQRNGPRFLAARYLVRAGNGFKADRWLVYRGDEEDPDLIHKQKAHEIKPWLQDELELDRSMSLENCFEQIIGVPQNNLVNAFVQSPRYREMLFNQVFNLQKYKQRALRLKPAEDAITAELEGAGNQLENLNGRIEAMRINEHQLKARRRERCETRRAVKEAVARAQEIAERKRRLEEIEHAVGEYHAELTTLDSLLPEMERRLETLGEDLAKAEAAEAFLTVNADRHAAFRTMQDEIRKLHELRREVDGLKEERASLTGTRAEQEGRLAAMAGGCQEEQRELAAARRELEDRHISLRGMLTGLRGELAAIAEQVRVYDDVQHRCQEIATELERMAEQDRGMRNELALRMEQLTEAQAAGRDAEQVKPPAMQYSRALSTRDELVKKQQALGKTRAALERLEGAAEAAGKTRAELLETAAAIEHELAGLDTAREAAARHASLLRRRDELTGRTSTLNMLKQRFDELTDALQAVHGDIENRAARMADLEKADLQELTERLRVLREQLNHLQQERGALDSGIKLRCSSAEEASGKLCPFGLGYCPNLPAGLSFEEFFAVDVARLKAELAALDSRREAWLVELDRLSRIHDEATSARERLAGLTEADARDRRTLTELQQRLLETAAERDRIAGAKAALVEVDAALRGLEGAGETLSKLLARADELQRIGGRIEELDAQSAERSREMAQLGKSLSDMVEIERGLAAANREVSDTQLRQAYERYPILLDRAARETELAESAMALRERLKAQEQRTTEMKSRLEKLRETYDAPAHIRLKEEHTALQRRVAAHEAEETAVAESLVAMHAREERLHRVGERMTELERSIRDLREEIERLDKAIAGRGDPSGRLAAAMEQEAAEAEFVQAHDRARVRLQELDGDIPELRGRLEALATTTRTRQVRRDELRGLLLKASETYSADDLVKIRLEHDETAAHQAKLNERTRSLDEEIRRLEAAVQELGELRGARIQARERKRELEVVRRLLRSLRLDIYQRAGALVVNRSLRVISNRANAIYKSIRRTTEEDLEWAAGYEVRIRRNGGEMLLMNDLSGGEQMAAALSIRLALLQTLTGIKLGFFDEPTNNLDAEKRLSLAQSLRNIELLDFHQLFVISHEEAFASATQSVILLDKDDDGVSFVRSLD